MLMSDPLRYALVAYVRNPVGEFVEKWRRELHPELPHLAAHLTILPTRALQSTEPAAREVLEEVCSGGEPLEVPFGYVETFGPGTSTVFISARYAAYRLRR